MRAYESHDRGAWSGKIRSQRHSNNRNHRWFLQGEMNVVLEQPLSGSIVCGTPNAVCRRRRLTTIPPCEPLGKDTTTRLRCVDDRDDERLAFSRLLKTGVIVFEQARDLGLSGDVSRSKWENGWLRCDPRVPFVRAAGRRKHSVKAEGF